MKKLWLVIVVCVVAVIAGGVLSLERRPGLNVMTDLKPFATKDKVLYFDPSEMFKSMPAGSVPPGTKLDPMAIRYMKLQGVSFDKINDILHRDLTTRDHWTFTPTMSGPASMTGFVSAYQGSSALTSLAGPEHAVTVMPDFSGRQMWSSLKPGVMPKPKDFVVMEMRRMPSWEVTWLKVKNLGPSPFSSQDQLMSAFTP